jgi:Ca-activated chloride channel family protein
LLAYRDQRGGFFSLLLEPPQVPAENEITPREMVFVLDCSGSMHGLPMDASKAFMRAALRKLRPTDSFRIIRFSDSANEFSASRCRRPRRILRQACATPIR